MDGAAPVPQEIDAGPLIEKIWHRLSRQYLGTTEADLPIHGSCVVRADRNDLYGVILQVVRFLLQRIIEPPDSDHHPILRVELEENARGAQMIFEDFSYRLGSALRERFFDPFAFGDVSAESEGNRFGLYVAKVMVVDRIGGTFEDLTDEMEGDLGHRLAITLPAAAGGAQSGA